MSFRRFSIVQKPIVREVMDYARSDALNNSYVIWKIRSINKLCISQSHYEFKYAEIFHPKQNFASCMILETSEEKIIYLDLCIGVSHTYLNRCIRVLCHIYCTHRNRYKPQFKLHLCVVNRFLRSTLARFLPGRCLTV